MPGSDLESGDRPDVEENCATKLDRSSSYRRRGLLRHAGAGVGLSVIGNSVSATPPEDTINFSNIGIRYRIEDDVDVNQLVDCSPGRWAQRGDEVYFFEERLNELERSHISQGRDIISAARVHNLPVRNVALSGSVHLPTHLDSDLRPERGVNGAGQHGPPKTRIVTAGRHIKVIARGNVRRIPKGESATIHLDPANISVMKKEVSSTNRQTHGPRENTKAISVEYTEVEATATPIIHVENRGEVPYRVVANQNEVN